MEWDYKFDTLQRFRLIEIVALWEGKLNANHLISHFGIGRQQASKDINHYLEKIGPDNLIYNPSAKGYVPSEQFKPQVTRGVVDEYLYLVRRDGELGNMLSQITLGFDQTHYLPAPQFAVKPDIFRPIVRACRENLRLEVDYRSVSAPNPNGRIIAPHSIVHSGTRWHVRAWCEKNGEFRDFVLSRFFDVPTVEGKSSISPKDDESWETKINVCFTPDQRLDREQQKVVANDYGMVNNKLVINVRASLIPYLLKAMNIDPSIIHADPCAQQIVIENISVVKPYLF